jgi:hypothetical protein
MGIHADDAVDRASQPAHRSPGLDVEVTGIVGVYRPWPRDRLLRWRGPPGVQPMLRNQARRRPAVSEHFLEQRSTPAIA